MRVLYSQRSNGLTRWRSVFEFFHQGVSFPFAFLYLSYRTSLLTPNDSQAASRSSRSISPSIKGIKKFNKSSTVFSTTISSTSSHLPSYRRTLLLQRGRCDLQEKSQFFYLPHLNLAAPVYSLTKLDSPHSTLLSRDTPPDPNQSLLFRLRLQLRESSLTVRLKLSPPPRTVSQTPLSMLANEIDLRAEVKGLEVQKDRLRRGTEERRT